MPLQVMNPQASANQLASPPPMQHLKSQSIRKRFERVELEIKIPLQKSLEKVVPRKNRLTNDDRAVPQSEQAARASSTWRTLIALGLGDGSGCIMVDSLDSCVPSICIITERDIVDFNSCTAY